MNFIYFHRYGGFANSLCIWQFCYELAKINDMKVAIYKYHFPESKYLNFPNTILLEQEPKNYVKTNSNVLESKNFKLDNKDNIELSCGWWFSRKLEHTIKERAVSKICFLDENLQKQIDTFCVDKIGIHFRRGDHNHHIKIKTPDSFYIQNCLSHKNDKFYLSTDAEQEELKIFDQFEIHRYDTFLNKKVNKVNCHSSGEPKSFKQKLYYIDNDLIKIKCIDLMCLSRCKKIIGCKHSTFSLIASYMGNNKELVVE